MKISSYKPAYKQPWLWDDPLGGHGHVRTVIGDLVEEMTAKLVGGRRHKTQSTAEYCPDVSRPLLEEVYCPQCGGMANTKAWVDCKGCDDTGKVLAPTGSLEFFESKAVGTSRTAFVYGGRLVKDRAFVAAGNVLKYVIWHHTVKTSQAKTVNELRGLIQANIKAVYMVPFVSLDQICAGLKEDKLNSKYGHSDEPRNCYGSGFRIRLSLLSDFIVKGATYSQRHQTKG